MSGVRIGKIDSVSLNDGHADVALDVEKQYAPLIHSDATFLLRPKTNLNDMVVEVTPGTSPQLMADGAHVPLASTQPNVNPDEVLATLDSDTRQYLQLLLQGVGTGLQGRGGAALGSLAPPLSLHPRHRPGQRRGRQAAAGARQRDPQLPPALRRPGGQGHRDHQLRRLLRARRSATSPTRPSSLQAAIGELPSTLRQTDTALTASNALSEQLGPALTKLTPQADAFAPALRRLQTFFTETAPLISGQITPFARQINPPLDTVRQTAKPFSKTVAGLPRHPEAAQLRLQRAGGEARRGGQSYLFYLPWLNHNLNSGYLLQDARRAAAARHDHAHLPDGDPGQRLRRRPPLPAHAPAAHQHPDRRADLLMATRAPSVGQIAIIAAFTPQLRRHPDLPLGHLRRLDPAEADRATRSRSPSPRRPPWPSRPTCGSAASRSARSRRSSSRPITATPWRRSRSTTPTRRCRPTPGPSCGPRRCSARPTSSWPRGRRAGPKLAEGATLPVAQVAPTVKLDEILRTFDEPTRAAFQTWMQNAAPAINGRGQDLGDAIGELQPTFAAFDDVFRTLDTQQQAVSQLFCQRRGHLRRLPGPPARPRRPDLRRRPRLRGHRPAQRRARQRLPRLPDLPRRVEGDGRAAADLLPDHRPADRAADPGGPSALADPGRSSTG